jgi:hypothetical protein
LSWIFSSPLFLLGTVFSMGEFGEQHFMMEIILSTQNIFVYGNAGLAWSNAAEPGPWPKLAGDGRFIEWLRRR